VNEPLLKTKGGVRPMPLPYPPPPPHVNEILILHVEYAGGRIQYGILFTFSLFCEYSNLEYVHVPAMYRVNQAECVIRILVAASQEYVNTYSTLRVLISFVAFRVDPKARLRSNSG